MVFLPTVNSTAACQWGTAALETDIILLDWLENGRVMKTSHVFLA